MNALITISTMVLVFTCIIGVIIAHKFMRQDDKIFELEMIVRQLGFQGSYKAKAETKKTPKPDTNGRYKFKPEVLYCKMDGTLIKRISGFEPYGNPLNFASIFSEETGLAISNNFEQSDDPNWNGQVFAVCEQTKDPRYAAKHGLKPVGYLYFVYDN
jgi:hypothetical protein